MMSYYEGKLTVRSGHNLPVDGKGRVWATIRKVLVTLVSWRKFSVGFYGEIDKGLLLLHFKGNMCTRIMLHHLEL